MQLSPLELPVLIHTHGPYCCEEDLLPQSGLWTRTPHFFFSPLRGSAPRSTPDQGYHRLHYTINMELLTLPLSEYTYFKTLFHGVAKSVKSKKQGGEAAGSHRAGDRNRLTGWGPQRTHLALLILTTCCETAKEPSQEQGRRLRAMMTPR